MSKKSLIGYALDVWKEDFGYFNDSNVAFTKEACMPHIVKAKTKNFTKKIKITIQEIGDK